MINLRRKNLMKYSIVGGVGLIFLIALIFFACRAIFMGQIESQQAQLQAVIKNKDAALKNYEIKTRKGWQVTEDVKAGGKLMEAMLKQVDLPDYFTPESVVMDKAAVTDKYTKIPLMKNSAITKEMLYEDGPIDPSLRKVETDYVRLPLIMEPSDVVDIRIIFPNGEDYIVVPKKKLDALDLANQMLFFKAPEAEINLLNSALVDAYINNAEIYAIKYADAEMQQTPLVNYMPNQNIMSIMDTNPAILEKAKYNLIKILRKELDTRMKDLSPSDRVRIDASLPPGSAVINKRKTNGSGAVLTPSTQPVNGGQAPAAGGQQPAPQQQQQQTGNNGQPQVPSTIQQNVPKSQGNTQSKPPANTPVQQTGPTDTQSGGTLGGR
jgi:hypothetical protein